ncbi:MAG: DUF58 domain-containing protein [Planctomycetota bacterium]
MKRAPALPPLPEPFPPPFRALLAELLARRSRIAADRSEHRVRRRTQFGHSGTFAGHRPYAPGDDPRRIDWAAYARSDELHVMQFEEEERRTAALLLDLSARLCVGEAPRRVGALRIAAIVGGLALRHLDGLEVHAPGAPSGAVASFTGLGDYERLLQHLAGLPWAEVAPRDAIAALLDRGACGRVHWISDFAEPAACELPLAALRRRGGRAGLAARGRRGSRGRRRRLRAPRRPGLGSTADADRRPRAGGGDARRTRGAAEGAAARVRAERLPARALADARGTGLPPRELRGDRSPVPLILDHPERLWWLGLLPVLLWLQLPPRPRRVVLASHLAQWLLAHEAVHRRPPRILSLRTLLLLLAGAAAVFAAAGLAVGGTAGPGRLVVLLDGSASMAAVADAGQSRFAAAAQRLRAAMAELPAHVEVTLLRCGGPVVRRHGASARALQDVGEPAGALAVDLAALARDAAADHTAVWTLTDGQNGTLPDVGALDVFGGAAANAAVLAVRVDDRWPLPDLALEADVIAFGAGDLPARVAASGAIEPAAPVDVALRTGEVATVRFACRRTAAGGDLTVAIALPGDALAADDRWRAELPPLPAPRIAVLADAEAGPFAAAAAAALAAEVQGEVVAAAPGTEVGLLLVDGGEAALTPGRQRALTFGTHLVGTAAATPWPAPRALAWDRTAPLLAGLDFSELEVRQAQRGILPDGQVLLHAAGPDGTLPLAVLCRGADSASVHFAFRLHDGNLPLLAAFPQLLRRAFVASYGAAAQLGARTEPPPPAEQDLAHPRLAAARPLPPFGRPPVPLATALMVAGCLILVARALCR